MLNETGVIIPDTEGSWIGGGGTNPADLGEDLKIFSDPNAVINTGGGNGPSSNGGC